MIKKDRMTAFRAVLKESIKMTKRDLILWAVTAVLLSFVVALGKQVVFAGDVWGTPEQNYVLPLSSQTWINFLTALLENLVLMYLCRLLNIVYQLWAVHNEKKKKNWLLFVSCLGIFMIAWLPYLLASLPGGVYSDTFVGIQMALNMDSNGLRALTNHHPVLYTLLWRLAIVVGRGMSFDMSHIVLLFQLVQYVVMAAVLSYMICWLKKKSAGTWLIVVLILLTALFPLFPLYAVSLWKDTPFSLVMLLYMLGIGDYVFSKDHQCLHDWKYIVQMAVLSVLVCFTRNNGKYIVLGIFLLMVLLHFKELKIYRKYFLTMFAALLTSQVILGPVFSLIKYNTDTGIESLGVPLQQISYLAYYDYDMTDAEKAYVEQICPISSIKEHYAPGMFDAIKWYDPDFDYTAIENNKAGFVKFYASMLVKHPLGCLKGYMLATAGFWAPNVASYAAYAQTTVWDNPYNVVSNDVWKSVFGTSINDFKDVTKPLSSAIFLFLTFYTCFLLTLNREYRKIMILAPGLLNWLTIMAATPTAVSMRYVYCLVLMVPIEIDLICTSHRKPAVNE